jgi:hypothetical protein
MLVVAEETDEGYVAASGGCLFDTNHNNIPIIGALFINTLQYQDDLTKEDKHYITMHEITHTLAFINRSTYTDNWTDLDTGHKHD